MAKRKQWLAYIKDWQELERLVEKGARIVALAPAPGINPELAVLVAVYE